LNGVGALCTFRVNRSHHVVVFAGAYIAVGVTCSSNRAAVKLTAPADFGENWTVNVALCPGVSVTAPPIPASVRPRTFDALAGNGNVRIARVPERDATLAGLMLNVRELDMPVPDTAIVTLLSDPVDFTTMDPLTLPADSGRNATVKCVSAPGKIDIGALIPEIEKPAALVVTLSTHIEVEPVLSTVMIWVSFVPTGTSPNGVLSGVTDA
jgi:hypothetical protein